MNILNMKARKMESTRNGNHETNALIERLAAQLADRILKAAEVKAFETIESEITLSTPVIAETANAPNRSLKYQAFTMLEAITDILKTERQPLHVTQLAHYLKANGYRFRTKHPVKTIPGVIHIAIKKGNSVVQALGKNTFGLGQRKTLAA